MLFENYCFKIILIYIICVINKTNTESSECNGQSPPDYCRFVFDKFITCCTNDVEENCKEFDNIFEWKNKYYVIYKRYIWPMEGFTRQGFPIFLNPAADTRDITDRQYFPGLGNVALKGFVQTVLAHNDGIFIAVRRSVLKHSVDIYVTEGLGEQVEKINQEARQVHDLFTPKFINKYLIRTAITIPMNTVRGLQNMVVAFLSSKKKTVNSIAMFNASGSLIEQKKGLKLKTCASAVYHNNNPALSKHKYVLFHNDGYMCHFQREYMDNSFMLDYKKSYKGYKNCILCWPIHVMVGCPQPFCLRADIDDFISTLDTESKSDVHYLHRGPYFWRLKANKLPLPFPKRVDAKLISISSSWPGSPSYIDAAFSVQNLGMEFTYIFKDDKVYCYVDSSPQNKPVSINKEFRSSESINFVDAAVYVPRSKTLFLFEGDYVHLFKSNFRGSQLFWNAAHPPLIAIAYNLTGLPGNIDAAIKAQNLLVATKENFYYLIDGANWDTAQNKKVYKGLISLSLKENKGLFESTSQCDAIYSSDVTGFKTLLKVFEPKPAESATRLKSDKSDDPLETDYENDGSDYKPIHKSRYKTAFIAFGIISAIMILLILALIICNCLKKDKEQTQAEIPTSTPVPTPTPSPPMAKKSSAEAKNKAVNKIESKAVTSESVIKQKNKKGSRHKSNKRVKK